MRIDATGTFSKEDGTLTIDLQFHPATPIEHEIVAEFVRHPKRTLVFPTKVVVDRRDPRNPVTKIVQTQELEGDVMNVRLELDDPDAFDQAVHNLENRRRATEGLPSLEDEAQRKADAEKQNAAAQEQSQSQAEKAEADLLASRSRIETLAAKEIADRYVKEHQTPAPAPTPVASEPSKEEEKPQATAKDPGTLQ
jgi:predicted ATP-dependent endonuclease of OLD family